MIFVSILSVMLNTQMLKCLVFLVGHPFAASALGPYESMKNVVALWSAKLSSLKRQRSHINSFEVLRAAINSASSDDLALQVCFDDL
jgi:hypothetical protein